LRGAACAALLLGSLAAVARAAAPGAADVQGGAAPDAAAAKPAAAQRSHHTPERFAGRADQYYRVVWGVDALTVKWVESGELIKFSYHVLDAKRAKVLSDQRSEPSLIDPKAGIRLVVPHVDKVGALRQTAPPENDHEYWIEFSNKGRVVKRGDRVDLVIGTFHANNLVVD
jgi:hypothetical protein